MAIIPENYYLTTTTTFTRVTPAGADVYDKKTGRLIKFVGEMSGPHNKIIEMAAVASSVLADTDGVKGFEEMQVLATKLLLSSVNSMETTINAAITKVEK